MNKYESVVTGELSFEDMEDVRVFEQVEIENPYAVMDYTDLIVQKVISKNIQRAYWLMNGQGGYGKSSIEEIRNCGFPVSVQDFREEAGAESALIYCEAVESYDSEHYSNVLAGYQNDLEGLENELSRADDAGEEVKLLNKIEKLKGKIEKVQDSIDSGNGKIKFITWLYWKLRDLDSRMWRILASGTKRLDSYVDAGKVNNFDDEFIFRDSLSSESKEVLSMLETGQGFRIKKSSEYDKANCHMGVRTFWETFIRDSEKKITFSAFLESWNEIRKAWNEIETDNMIYTVIDSEAV